MIIEFFTLNKKKEFCIKGYKKNYHIKGHYIDVALMKDRANDGLLKNYLAS